MCSSLRQTTKMLILKRKFSRSFAELEHIFHFIEEYSEQNHVPAALVQDISLAVEELFTNMVKYNPDGPAKVELSLSIERDTLRIDLTDREKTPFDITKSEVYDLNKSVEERPVGRLGLFFVKKVMDRIEYNNNENRTVITMTKHLGERNV